MPDIVGLTVTIASAVAAQNQAKDSRRADSLQKSSVSGDLYEN